MSKYFPCLLLSSSGTSRISFSLSVFYTYLEGERELICSSRPFVIRNNMKTVLICRKILSKSFDCSAISISCNYFYRLHFPSPSHAIQALFHENISSQLPGFHNTCNLRCIPRGSFHVYTGHIPFSYQGNLYKMHTVLMGEFPLLVSRC